MRIIPVRILVKTSLTTDIMAHVMLEAIRSKVEKETQKHQYGNALFWADKAVSLGGGG